MNNLQSEIRAEVSSLLCDQATADYWLERLENDQLTRDDGNMSHFCCYFLPYNPDAKQIFIVHHKKSGLWLSPGGHIDQGESLMQTLNREIQEELGVADRISNLIKPFLLTITPISNPVQPCKEHLDLWYRFPTDGSEFKVDPKEFHTTKWATIAEARELVTDPPNVQALDKMEDLFKN